MQAYRRTFQTTRNGVVVLFPSATITVYRAGTNTLATLFSDNGVTALTNPFTSTALGEVRFYAADGRYDVVASKTGFTTTRDDDVLLEDPIDNSLRNFAAEGGIGDRSTDNLAALNTAIARTPGSELYLPDGDFRVSAIPTNPLGIPLPGPGKVLLPEPNGFRQLNTYADEGKILVGKENLYRAYQRISLGPAGASSQLGVSLHGDSTIEGFILRSPGLDANFLVQNLLKTLFARQGIVNTTITNRGVSGTNWSQLDLIPHLGASLDLAIIGYGHNDGALLPGQSVANRIALMASTMRAKLDAIRTSPFGDLTNLAIILRGPNAMNDTGHGRNEEWFEQVRNVYVRAARDFDCCYFDTYAYLQNARKSALLWMDNPTPANTGDALYTANSSVHPYELMNAWIWGGLIDHAFGKSEVAYWATNNFVNIGLNSGSAPASSKLPNAYSFGKTWELGQSGSGFPATGILETKRNPDTYAFQQLLPLAAVGRIYRRFAATGTTWQSFWTGVPVALPGSNSWVSFGGTAALATATRDSSGLVTVEGAIKDGVPTAGTLMVTLPEGFRPPADHYFLQASSTATPVRVKVAANGEITCETTADATMTSLSGIKFRAA